MYWKEMLIEVGRISRNCSISENQSCYYTLEISMLRLCIENVKMRMHV